MKRKIILLLIFVPFLLLLIILPNSLPSNQYGIGVFKVFAVRPNCTNFTVTVVRNGGGYSDNCNVDDPVTCSCAVSGVIEGYYTITADDGTCTGTHFNVYHPGTGIISDTITIFDCYK